MSQAPSTTLAPGPRRFTIAAGIWLAYTPAALIVLGILLRLARYLANRSLWIDEVFLANNLIHRSALELLKPLDYRQGAGVGFLLLCKAAISVFGHSEYALRLVPLLSGLAALLLFWLLVKRLLDPPAALIALALMALVEPLIYYSSEIKQYSTDVAVALAILLSVVRCIENPQDARRMVVLAIVGVVGIFVSHPAVFVLAGAALALARSRKRWDVPLLSALAVWAVTIAINYFFFLKPLEMSAGLQKHWADLGGYPPMSLAGAAAWLYRRFFGAFADFATMWLRFERLGVWPARVAAILSIVGFICLWRPRRTTFVLIVTPIGTTILAAAMRKYPFEDRLILFLVPLFIIAIAQGTWVIWHCWRGVWGKGLSMVLIGTVLLPTTVRATGYLLHSPGREEIKPVLNYLAPKLKEGDLLYLYHAADAPYLYYRGQSGIPERPFVMGSRPSETPGGYTSDLRKITGHPRVWLLFSHVWDTPDGGDEEEMLLKLLDERGGRRVEQFSATGASVYLYDLSDQAKKRAARRSRNNCAIAALLAIPLGPSLGFRWPYMELFTELQRSKTLAPTAPMAAMEATTIRPMINAYSKTSPPRSSLSSFLMMLFIVRSPSIKRRDRSPSTPQDKASAIGGKNPSGQ